MPHTGSEATIEQLMVRLVEEIDRGSKVRVVEDEEIDVARSEISNAGWSAFDMWVQVEAPLADESSHFIVPGFFSVVLPLDEKEREAHVRQIERAVEEEVPASAQIVVNGCAIPVNIYHFNDFMIGPDHKYRPVYFAQFTGTDLPFAWRRVADMHRAIRSAR